VGSGVVNVIRLEATSDPIDITVEGTPFMGTVEAGSSAPLDVTVTPREPGPATIAILVTYRDAFNQTQTLTTTLSVEVAGNADTQTGENSPLPASSPPGETEEGKRPVSTLWQRVAQILKGFLGFGS